MRVRAALRLLPWVAAVLAAFAALPVAAGEIRVPADAPTIQAAVNRATDGDTILVDEGSYRENVRIVGKRIEIRSTGCPRRTIIDGGALGSALRIEAPGARIEGLEIIGGHADRGGGISIGSTNPMPIEVTLARLIIERNLALDAGGAIAAATSTGAPIRLRMENCLVDKNVADRGGGIFLEGAAGPVEALIVNCTVAENIAGSQGAGLAIDGAVIGIPIAFNDIFWRNESPSSDEKELSGLPPGSVRFSYIGDVRFLGMDGNFLEPHDDPGFREPAAGDYRLRPGSPALDAGVPGIGPAIAPLVDFDLAERFDDPGIPDLNGGWEPCGIDDGAGTFIRGDATGDAVVDISDPVFTFDYLFMSTRYRPCIAAMDSNDDGAVDISDGVFTLGYLFLGGKDIPAPYPLMGLDPTAGLVTLPCAMYPACWSAEQ
jgi:hypothetical protein